MKTCCSHFIDDDFNDCDGLKSYKLKLCSFSKNLNFVYKVTMALAVIIVFIYNQKLSQEHLA